MLLLGSTVSFRYCLSLQRTGPLTSLPQGRAQAPVFTCKLKVTVGDVQLGHLEQSVRGLIWQTTGEKHWSKYKIHSHRHIVLAFLSTLSVRVTWCHYWCGCRGSVFSLMSVGISISDAHLHAYHSLGPWHFRAKKPRQPYSVSTKKEQSLSM